jgi:hypothetical protein
VTTLYRQLTTQTNVLSLLQSIPLKLLQSLLVVSWQLILIQELLQPH